MSGEDAWNKILSLVPAERLQNADTPSRSSIVEEEQQLIKQFDQEYAAHTAHIDSWSSNASFPSWDLARELQTHQARIAEFQRWLQRCNEFDSVASQLQVSGRAALYERLSCVKRDTARALVIVQQMLEGAIKTRQNINGIAAATQKELLDRQLAMNASLRKLYGFDT